MALRLRVVSEHAHRLGTQATKVFGVHGGSIGRATDNDWILPDPERYLSGRHMRVEFRAGVYFVVDASSNGTFVNGSQNALGRSNAQQLKDGDYVRLGEYELLVSIDASNDFPPEDSAIVAYDGVPSSVVKKSTADDIGANLDLSELLEPSGSLTSAVENAASDPVAKLASSVERSLFGAPAKIASSAAGVSPTPAMAARDAYGQPFEQTAEENAWHMATRPIKVERTAAAAARLAEPLTAHPSRKASQFAEADFDEGLMAICRGAGIEPQSIAPEARAAALRMVGQLLREVAVGIVDLAQSQKEFRNRFRVSEPPAELRSGNDFFDRGVEQALARLLSTTTSRGGSVDAIRESFQEIKAQQIATLTAMRAAFEEFLSRLDPKDLAERFERNTKRGVFGSQNKGRYWELYTDLFASMANRPSDGFPHLFVETFARAFEQQVLHLPPLKRVAFGTDLSASGDRFNEA